MNAKGDNVQHAVFSRRLVAILCADIAGYSRLMGAKEESTHARVKAIFRSVVDPVVSEHRGRVVKTMGDGFLALFESPLEAVRCAIVIQQSVSQREAESPSDQNVQFRIGINLGDVIIESDDVFGDGVNIAARLQTLASPGDVYISAGVYEQVKNKLVAGYQSLGDGKLKNITDPVRIYRVLPDAAAVASVQRNKWAKLIWVAAAVAIVIGGAASWYAWERSRSEKVAEVPPLASRETTVPETKKPEPPPAPTTSRPTQSTTPLTTPAPPATASSPSTPSPAPSTPPPAVNQPSPSPTTMPVSPSSSTREPGPAQSTPSSSAPPTSASSQPSSPISPAPTPAPDLATKSANTSSLSPPAATPVPEPAPMPASTPEPASAQDTPSSSAPPTSAPSQPSSPISPAPTPAPDLATKSASTPTPSLSRPTPPTAAAVPEPAPKPANTPEIVAAPAIPVNQLKPGQPFRDCADCPEMTIVAPGEFEMGSNDILYAKPPHAVKIARTFAIGRREVSFDEWDQCLAAGACKHRPDDRGWGRGNRPIIDISWRDAKAYAEWLSQKTGQKYRLPSEAEWEYTARAGTSTAFWWGRDAGSGHANCTDCGGQPAQRQTTPAGAFQPNAFGLYDTAGNVAEWVEDCWNDSYRNAPRDGSAWTRGQCEQRVLRGGSFTGNAASARSASRFRYDNDVRYYANGFRVVRELD